MKKQDANKWVEALRSGKYKQITGELRDGEGGFCCLGVLDEINPGMDLSEGSDEELLDYHKIGLTDSIGRLFYEDSYRHIEIREGCAQHISLASLNDHGYTFDEIADVIQIEYVLGV